MSDEGDLLQEVYLDAVKFEKKARSSFGAEFSTLLSKEQVEGFLSRFVDLMWDDSADAQLAYLRLVDEMLTVIAPSFPVNDLHILWPSAGATAERAAFLVDHGCDCLASIVQQASRRAKPTGPFPNKFKF